MVSGCVISASARARHSAIETGLQEAERKGLIERPLSRVRPTQRALIFEDLQAIFPVQSPDAGSQGAAPRF